MTEENQTSKNKSPYIIWTDDTDLARAENNIDAYDGIMSANASRRSYLDIEPNISVRSSFTKQDYYRFREEERPGVAKRAMEMCMEAYDKVGIIKNVIDLMGDFASQGITIHHPNKKIEKFYRKWWEKINGAERSERFLNNLYRCGNVIVQKRYGKITRKLQREMSKGSVVDYEIKQKKVETKTLPMKYTFLNPLIIDVLGNNSVSMSENKKYKMKIPASMRTELVKPENEQALQDLPKVLQNAIKNGKDHIILDPQTISTYFYKKDDWQVWANPMINAIIDDIIMLEKMKLADMSALDGAISNIRLWNVGDFEHKILPTRAGIDKLRNILASNVGGGTMDLIWGPELKFTESNTQIYKFLGNEKYNPVLNSIYAGLGIPPTLTGLAGQSGGFTNNFISLKTLIERLEYGRDVLKSFLMEEIIYIQKSMGFPSPAYLHFDDMILSDETAEKNLWIQLADRNIISYETLREKLGAINEIEHVRVNNEEKMRSKKKMPPKSDPYHHGDAEHDYIKIAMQKGEIGIEDVTDITASHPEVLDVSMKQEKERKVDDPGGRPKFSKDKNGRKQREVKPKDTPAKNSEALIVWANEAQKQISSMLTSSFLHAFGKKDIRALSKEEIKILEDVKFATLCHIEPYDKIDGETVAKILDSNPTVSSDVKAIEKSLLSTFIEKNERQPTTDELRHIRVITYYLAKK